jgi:hypothetical protein
MSEARSVRGRQLRLSLARVVEPIERRRRQCRRARPWRYRLLAADSDVVLGVTRGIVRVAGGIVRAEVCLSGGIDRRIGVAAGERERHKGENDRDPHFAYLEFNTTAPSAFATGF